MKQRLLLLAVALFATATAVRAQEHVRINSSNFPDSKFREIVKGKDIDKNQNGWLETGELAAVTTLTARSKSIESLKGVEHFFKLTTLDCENNRLSSLDVSKITTLKALYCSQNRLTSLDVSKNTALTMLYCYDNQLTSLDVSKNTALTALLCYDNKLTSLDLTNNKALTNLSCYLNQIGHSDMLKLVNSLPTVTNGYFYGISISSSTEKNVLAKSRVEIAQGKGWSVKAKDGSSNVDYEGSEDPVIAIDATNFPDENFRAIVAGTDIDKDADGKLSEEEIAAVTVLDVMEKNIASLKGIEFFTALTDLYCSTNQLTSLDVSKNTALKDLWCTDNQLTSLDVSKNTALTELYCEFNQLASLDVSKNTALTKLYCWNNQLTSLDVSKNTALTLLECFNNQIKGDKMQALVNSLPTVTNGKFWVIDTKNSNEQNVCTKDQVAIAKGKGWTVYDNNGGSQKEYAGSDESGIAIDATNFPDETFRAVVAGTKIDKDADGYLSDEEIAAVTELNIMFNNIASLKGIEFFTALTQLVCSYNQLTSLDVSKNTALTELYCYENQLTSLDVSKNTALTVLACFGNQIKEDKMQALVNSLPKVTSGEFGVIDTKSSNEQNVCTKEQVAIATGKGWTVYDYNGGTPEVLGKIAIDATNFPDENFRAVVAGTDIDKDADGYLSDEEIAAVTQLDVREMGIQNLKGIEFFTGLKELLCPGNELTSLDVSKNTELTRLACGQNQIKSLDLSKNTKMENLHCANNQLTALDVSMMPNLWRLYCRNNKLTKLDVTKNTKLTELTCSENQLTALDVSNNTELTWLDCYRNSLTSLDVSKNTALKVLHCFDNQLTSLNVTKNTAMTWLNCDNNELTSLDVTKNTALTLLDCLGNKLTALDVSKNTELTELRCWSNELTSLNLSYLDKLETVWCNDNKLTSLNAKGCTSLKKLNLFHNAIKGSEMDALIGSLPDRTPANDGMMVVMDEIEEQPEGNVMTKDQVSVAVAKGWKVYEIYDISIDDNGNHTYHLYNYEGSDPSAIGSIEVYAEEKGLWYSLDGKRLSGKPTKKGIYVRNGRKVVVK